MLTAKLTLKNEATFLMLDAVIQKFTCRAAYDPQVLVHTKTKDKAITGEIVECW
jgi:hypothetical protein